MCSGRETYDILLAEQLDKEEELHRIALWHAQIQKDFWQEFEKFKAWFYQEND